MISRRHANALLASVTASIGLPFPKLSAGATRPVPDQVKAVIAGWTPERIAAALHGTYADIFTLKKSTMAVEQVVHVLYASEARVDHRFEDWGQRFVYCAETYEVALGFGVVPDGDPRAVRPDDIAISDLFNLKAYYGVPSPVAVADAGIMLEKLMRHFRAVREVQAAEVINSGTRYNPTIGGDGVSLFANHHPHETGQWANTFRDSSIVDTWANATYHPLTPESFLAAHAGLANFCDDQGLLINVRPRKLVMAADIAPLAIAPGVEQVTWDALRPGTWFIQTNIEGLIWFERHPFELDVWHDVERDITLIKGYERRAFTYTNPRAVFGCVPPQRA